MPASGSLDFAEETTNGACNQWDHGIEEADGNQTRNTYSNINCQNAAVSALELLGLDDNIDFDTIMGVINASDYLINADPVPLDLVHYVNATPSTDGLTINAGGEAAYYFANVPYRVSRGLRFEVKGVAHAAPGAGNQMHLAAQCDAGGDNEAKNVHTTGALANIDSYGNGNAINDIITWVITDANINAITGGDSVKLTLNHEAAAAPDIATNASIYQVIFYCA